MSDEEINRIFVRFKELADVKKEVFDEDLEAIVYEESSRHEEKYRFLYLNVVSGNATVPTATMQMDVDGRWSRRPVSAWGRWTPPSRRSGRSRRPTIRF